MRGPFLLLSPLEKKGYFQYNKYIETFAEDMELVNGMRSEGEVVIAGMIKSIRHHITKTKKEKERQILRKEKQKGYREQQ